MAKRVSKPLANGRNKGPMDRFTRIGHRMQSSLAYRTLNSNARNLLFEMTMMHSGENNGSLWLSVRDAARRMGVVDINAARQAFDDLEEAGFIRMTVNSFFEVKAATKSRARCWRLTWLPVVGVCGETDDWKGYMPTEPQKANRAERGQKALADFRNATAENRLPVLDFNTLRAILASDAPRRPITVLDSNTGSTQNCASLEIDSVSDSNTHIAIAIGSRDKGLGWWHLDAQIQAIACLSYCFALVNNPSKNRLAA